MAEKKAAKKKAETKKTTAKKSTPKVEWHDGYPAATGLFHCRQGKKETVLRHLQCDMTGKDKWATMAGQIPLGAPVEWEGQPLSFDDVQKFVEA